MRQVGMQIGAERRPGTGTFESDRPVHGRALGGGARGDQGRRRRRGRGRAGGVRGRVGRHDRRRARAAAAPAGRADHESRRRSRGRRDAGQRQAAARDGRPGPRRCRPGTSTTPGSPTRSTAGSWTPGAATSSGTSPASRSASSPRSCRGTRRCCCSPSSSPRRWRPGARWSPSRRSRPRCRSCCWPSCFEEAGFPPGVFNTVSGAVPPGRRVAGRPPGRRSRVVHRLGGDRRAPSPRRPRGTSPRPRSSSAASPRTSSSPTRTSAAAANGLVAGIFAAAGADLHRRVARPGPRGRLRRDPGAGRRARGAGS